MDETNAFGKPPRQPPSNLNLYIYINAFHYVYPYPNIEASFGYVQSAEQKLSGRISAI